MKDVLFPMGPSRLMRLVSRPSPTEPWTFLELPSRPRISSTDEMRPPNSAGIELLYSSTSFTTSVLKADMMPNMWLGLYMVPPLKRTRFWSTEPPRTLKPDEASPAVLTPGRVRTTLSTSASPKATGTLAISLTRIRSMPILASLCAARLSADTIAPLSEVTFSFITTSRPPSPYTMILRCRSSME